MKKNQLKILEMKYIVTATKKTQDAPHDIETAEKKMDDLESSILQECTISKLRDRKYENLINSIPTKIHVCAYIYSFINNFRRFPAFLKFNFYLRILNTKYLSYSVNTYSKISKILVQGWGNRHQIWVRIKSKRSQTNVNQVNLIRKWNSQRKYSEFCYTFYYKIQVRSRKSIIIHSK